MAWRDFFRPKRNVRTDGVFKKCDGCAATVRVKEVEENLGVCPECGYHFRLPARRRIEITVDPGTFQPLFEDVLPDDPLRFVAKKSYADRLGASQKATGLTEAVLIGRAKIEGADVIIGATDCNFMMGSMGSVVGERVTRGAEMASLRRVPFIMISGSGGGARMDEGALSLMQMAKTSAAIGRLHRAGVAYIVIVTNPTYGGVSASFASLGDVIIGEPRAQMGFTGPRVIKQTMKVELPPGFQESEFLRDHGQIDAVVERSRIRPIVACLVRYLEPPAAAQAPPAKERCPEEVADPTGQETAPAKGGE